MFSTTRASMLLLKLLVSFASIAIGPELSEAATFYNAVPPDSSISSSADRSDPSQYHKSYSKWEIYVVLVLGISVLLLIILFLHTNNVRQRTKDKEVLKKLTQSPPIEALEEAIVNNIPEETRSELVFFVEQEEWFDLDELLDGAADLRTQGFCSSLYMVQLKNKNNSVFAVKRLKKLKASFEEFGFTMKKIGNLRHSNILPLVGNEEPLISEYGYAKFIEQSRSACLFYNGYAAPEKMLTEQADVYSFGVILLELLTGKNVEKSGLDLPKWVRAMVREEWTGEVFDKDVVKVQMYAFPLLNVSLKCVEIEPEERPRIAEVLEKIEELFNDQECNLSFESINA
ncbi:hypothetical protein ACJIZ3_007003 [Penstemon smallii]|uniref:Protein kinase domain-containing protein n=1 Tax=Penstemon smallii TaxID=265156 RepID=A0ABD3S9T5_9LAMI